MGRFTAGNPGGRLRQRATLGKLEAESLLLFGWTCTTLPTIGQELVQVVERPEAACGGVHDERFVGGEAVRLEELSQLILVEPQSPAHSANVLVGDLLLFAVVRWDRIRAMPVALELPMRGALAFDYSKTQLLRRADDIPHPRRHELKGAERPGVTRALVHNVGDHPCGQLLDLLLLLRDVPHANRIRHGNQGCGSPLLTRHVLQRHGIAEQVVKSIPVFLWRGVTLKRVLTCLGVRTDHEVNCLATHLEGVLQGITLGDDVEVQAMRGPLPLDIGGWTQQNPDRPRFVRRVQLRHYWACGLGVKLSTTCLGPESTTKRAPADLGAQGYRTVYHWLSMTDGGLTPVSAR